MIANLSPSPAHTQEKFLEMLHAIRRQAHFAFQHCDPESREELTAEVVANCYCAYRRLVDRGCLERAYPTPLADYAIRQVRAGRRIGNPSNIHDMSSAICQRQKGVTLKRLDRHDVQSDAWHQILVEDRQAGPADVAMTRIDFGAWLNSLPKPTRRAAEILATGEATGQVARMFGLTPGRISQLRRELYRAWLAFIGEAAPGTRSVLP
jgi:hypothetical protein